MEKIIIEKDIVESDCDSECESECAECPPIETPLETPEEVPDDIPTPTAQRISNSVGIINEKEDKPITIPPKKVKEKKPRSEKQIAAFNKLQRRRAEQVELIRKQKMEQAEAIIEKKKKKATKKKKVIEYNSSDDEGNGRSKVVNNYYYSYGEKKEEVPERPKTPVNVPPPVKVYFA